LWIHVPKDGVQASTLGVVAGLWLVWAGFLFLPGIVLVDLPINSPILTGLGFVLIGIAGVSYLIGLDCVRRASRTRRAWRRQHF